MVRNDEAYAYGIIRQAALQSAAETTGLVRGRYLRLAGFAQRSARLIGAVA